MHFSKIGFSQADRNARLRRGKERGLKREVSSGIPGTVTDTSKAIRTGIAGNVLLGVRRRKKKGQQES